MKTRKNTASRQKATPSLEKQGGNFEGLRQLSQEEMKQAWDSAYSAKQVHEPTWLRTIWGKRKEDAKVEAMAELVAMIRRALKTPEIDDPEKSSRYVVRLVYLIVQQFERMVAGGVVDEMLPGLNALPLLYSITAGNGASKWAWALKLFKEKGVGTHANAQHGRSDAVGTRTLQWRFLAEDASTVARYAALELAKFDELKGRAVGCARYVFRRLRAHYGLSGIFYLLDDGSVLLWPDWLEKCRGLPLEIKENIPRYEEACLALAQEFFGDPHNKHSVELLEPLVTKALKNGQTKGRARMEAAQMVAAAVGRLGGQK